MYHGSFHGVETQRTLKPTKVIWPANWTPKRCYNDGNLWPLDFFDKHLDSGLGELNPKSQSSRASSQPGNPIAVPD
jgi:hypothetical protein